MRPFAWGAKPNPGAMGTVARRGFRYGTGT